MSLYDDIISDFNSRCANSPLLKSLVNDVGIQNIVKTLAYSQEQRQKELLVEMSELINPRSEKVLLHKLATKHAYLRLQQPLEVKFRAYNPNGILYPKHTMLTDGANMYITKYDYTAQPNQQIEVKAMFAFKRSMNANINTNIYTKVDLDCTYRELSNIDVRVGDKQLIRSQCFIDPKSHYMLEISPKNTMILVVRRHDLNVGDTLDIDIFTSSVSATAPSKLSFIEYSDTIIDNIEIHKPAVPFDLTKELRDKFKYDKNPIGSLLFNEDYYHFIRSNVQPFTYLEVWLEDCNKIYVSYESIVNQDESITKLIHATTPNKEIIFVAPIFLNTSISLTLTNYTLNSIPSSLLDTVRALLIGRYDKSNPLSKSKIHRKLSDILDEDIEIHIDIELPVLGNGKIIEVTNNDIEIEVKNETT